MPLGLDFFYYDGILLLMFILWTIAYAFFLLAGFRLKKDEREFKYVKLLVIIGIIGFLYNIIVLFIPRVTVDGSLTALELSIGFIYDFTTGTNLSGALLVIQGMSFMYFGLKNREFYGDILIIAGIFRIFLSAMNIISNIIYYYLAWFVDWQDPAPLTAYSPIFSISTLIQHISLLVYGSILIFYTVRIRNLYFFAFSIMSLGLFIRNFIVFLL